MRSRAPVLKWQRAFSNSLTEEPPPSHKHRDYVNNFPYLRTILKTVLGANSRQHYKISGAKEHPRLREYW